MVITTRPATDFEGVRALVGPKRPDANVCWCLSHRVPAKLNRELVGPARAEFVRAMCESDLPPGVLAYDGDEPVGWAGVAPRADTQFARSRTIPHVDDLPVWTAWCFRVRPGHRRKGVLDRLLRGAIAFARERGAPALEGYPVDNRVERVDQTMAFVGFRDMFERAGLTKAADTTSVSGGFPRVVMRLDLRR
jgi:GNAT superfamily N-acetyltransferase